MKVEIVGHRAFYGNPLVTIVITDGLKTVGMQAFTRFEGAPNITDGMRTGPWTGTWECDGTRWVVRK